MKIYAASDHAGYALRRSLIDHLRQTGHEVVDLGPPTADRTDYPDHARKVTAAVQGDGASCGLLVCGSGFGMSIAANRERGIRAINAWTPEVARLARAHNDANVLCLGERLLAPADAAAILDAFLATPFDGGRHAARIAKIESQNHLTGGPK